MWVYSTSQLNLSSIGSLTTEIYLQTGVTGNTDRQTVKQVHTLNLMISPYRI